MKLFSRDYQIAAAEEVERLRVREDKRLIYVVSPVATGKTQMMVVMRDRFLRRGWNGLALTPLAEGADQLVEAGLPAITVQSLASTVDKYRGMKSRRRLIEAELGRKLGVPPSFFSSGLVVFVDEAQWGLERLSSIYDRALAAFPNIELVCGFTGTPTTLQTVFPVVDVSREARSHSARQYGSIMTSLSLVTAPLQLSLFRAPGIVFCRNVVTGALLAKAMNFFGHRAALFTDSLPDSLERWLDSLAASKRDGERLDRIQETADGGLRESLDKSGYGADTLERRLGILAQIVQLEALGRLPQGRFLLREELTKSGGIPRWDRALRILERYDQDFYKGISALVRGEATARLRRDLLERLLSMGIPVSETQSDLTSGRYDWGVSVYKLSASFNYPEIRTIAMAENVVSSEILYEQRTGRGARRTAAGKTRFDVVEFSYLDPMANLSKESHSWLYAKIKDDSRRREILASPLIFREPLDAAAAKDFRP